MARKGIYNFKNQTSWQKVKNMNHFEFLSFDLAPKWVTGALHGNSLVVRRVSPGRILVVLFWTKYAVPRQIKPGILKLTTSRGQRNLCTVFIFVSCEEKGCYRIASLGHQNFDYRSYCGLSRRMQGVICNERPVQKEKVRTSLNPGLSVVIVRVRVVLKSRVLLTVCQWRFP